MPFPLMVLPMIAGSAKLAQVLSGLRGKTEHGKAIPGDVAALQARFQRDPQGAAGQVLKNLAKWGDCSGWGTGCLPHRNGYLQVARAAGMTIPRVCVMGGKGQAAQRVAAGCALPQAAPAAPLPTAVTPVAPGLGLSPEAVLPAPAPALLPNPGADLSATLCRLTRRC